MNERPQPQAIEAEQSIIGAMLQHTEALHAVLGSMKEEYFYVPKHRKIFSAVKKLFEDSVVIDLITVPDELFNREQLDEIGGRRYLFDLVDSIVTFSDIKDHINIVIKVATKNKLITDCNNIITRCYDPNITADDIMNDAQTKIIAIEDEYVQSELIKSCDILEQTIEEITMYQEGKKMGLLTPWDDLNKITAGYHPGEFTVLASRPGVGKTSMALNITDHLAVKQGIPVMFFSLEMPVFQLQARMLCSMAKVSFHDIRFGKATNNDLIKIVEQATPMSEAPIIFDNSSGLEIMTLKTKARQAHKKHGVQIIFIDYLQKLKSPGSENRDREVTVISNELTALAMELYIPVVGLAQLSRDVEKRGKGAIPKLSDLRESGTLEQDATVATFLHRNRTEDKETGKVTLDPETLVIVAKQRHGETGATYLNFDGKYTTFKPATMRTDDERY